MKVLLSFCLCLIGLHSRAHLNYIHLEKIDPTGQYTRQTSFLTANHSYFDHWEASWKYPVSKDSLVQQLQGFYQLFSNVHADQLETDLLVGEIANYLYNLSVEEYFEKAESAYLKAIRLVPGDFRGYWFLAHHYGLSQVEDKSVDYFEKAQTLLPNDEPALFWEEYAFTMTLANMPSHVELALDKAKKILGKPSPLVSQLGNSLEKRLVRLDPDSNYKIQDLWVASRKGRQVGFVSRPLGVKLTIDSSWGIQLQNFTNHRSAVTLEPAVIASNNGKNIGFSIAIIMKLADKGETLEDYIATVMGKEAKPSPITLHAPYKNILSYEIHDPSVYPDWGGEYSHMIGIEETDPDYPGLAIEEPAARPKGEPGKVNYYRPGTVKTRFTGRIFYLLLLDTCEDIHDKSLAIFKTFLESQAIFE